MKIYKTEITTHDFEGIFDGFCVEIVQGETTEFYLYHKECKIKMYMFGIESTTDECKIRDIIASNIEKYIEIYTEEFLDEIV